LVRWDWLPGYYSVVLEMVLTKQVEVDPFVEVKAMSTVAATFEGLHKSGSPAKRILLKPDF
jgi:6-hydroxycyclohex-1-ene-1-carbonyl-CoA dehydrogenase